MQVYAAGECGPRNDELAGNCLGETSCRLVLAEIARLQFRHHDGSDSGRPHRLDIGAGEAATLLQHKAPSAHAVGKNGSRRSLHRSLAEDHAVPAASSAEPCSLCKTCVASARMAMAISAGARPPSFKPIGP